MGHGKDEWGETILWNRKLEDARLINGRNDPRKVLSDDNGYLTCDSADCGQEASKAHYTGGEGKQSTVSAPSAKLSRHAASPRPHRANVFMEANRATPMGPVIGKEVPMVLQHAAFLLTLVRPESTVLATCMWMMHKLVCNNHNCQLLK
ncbi:hypothetical protein BaRGS_00019117 [Batillaria attramentaria]|uniref:Uncharacterized protein n=1 Tax=Batillaria attramentaria TaxID=370345 RepID=A0ABD0KR23_9CAEN